MNKDRLSRFLILILVCPLLAVSQQNRLSLDNGWRFYQGDIAFPVLKSHEDTYGNAKAGKAWGAAAPEYNDNGWRILNLPHDWAVEGGFDSTENVSQGYRKRGIGWYRRAFKLDPADKGKHLELQFDGIATWATIWFNGTLVHRNWCGYSSFYIDISSMARYGDEINTIAVRVDANAMEGWWYEGAGIYRHTWLVKRNPLHIITDGVYAHPVHKDDENWILPVEVTLYNSGETTETVDVESSLYDGNGKLVGRKQVPVRVGQLQQATASYAMDVFRPVRWSTEHPQLYKVVTKVIQNGHLSDELVTNCGFRTIRFTPDSGFYLNGKRIKLQGVCNHQDHAGVGVALPDALWEFRLRKLKELGVNAYRCSHNPPSREFLEICDSLGIMVMDENRHFNASPEYMRQLEWMVRRDRNHPSVILWSVFNEEPMQGSEQGYEMVRRMRSLVRTLDTTRPVTAAMNGGLFTPKNVSQAVDVVGFNYQIGSYDRFHKENPQLPLTSSEDGSAFQIRGEYVTDKKKNRIGSYDTEAAPWGATHRHGWKVIEERPWMAGGFYWTGFDYRGEPTPFTWPSAGSYFGIMDQCGFPKTAYWIHQSFWRKDIPVLQLVPHWNWPADSIGKKIRVMCVSNLDSVKVLLNGKKVAAEKINRFDMNSWEIPYKPGSLEAVGYQNGKIVSRFKTETTGKPASLFLEPYRQIMEGDGLDAMTVTVSVLDDKGRKVPDANLPVSFSVNGPAAIIGLGNGDPNSHEPEKGNQRSLFNGLAQVILQTFEEGEGYAELTATATGLKPFTLRIPVRKKKAIPAVPAVLGRFSLSEWRMSPFYAVRPDPKMQLADNDMNSWTPVKPGQLIKFSDDKFALFSSQFRLTGVRKPGRGLITLRRVAGKAEVWLNGERVAARDSETQADIKVPFVSGDGMYRMVVLIESETQKAAGLGGSVIIEPEQ